MILDMKGLDLERLVFIRVKPPEEGKEYKTGTGYFVTNNLVLTAKHVVSAKPDDIEIRLAGGDADSWKVIKDISWKGKKLDAALLEAEIPNLNNNLPNLNPGKYNGVIPYESIGYPKASIKITAEGSKGSEASLSGEYEVKTDELLVKNPPSKGEAWQGVSGAPVFIGDTIIGIVKSYPTGFDGNRLKPVLIKKLQEKEEDFTRTIEFHKDPVTNYVPDTEDLWFLVLQSEAEKSKLKKIVETALRFDDKAKNIYRTTGKNVSLDPVIGYINEVLYSKETFLGFLEAVCKAEVMIVDVTDFQPAVLLILGIRAVVKRGVTITTTSKEIDQSQLSKLPFNIQETKLLSLNGPEPDTLLRIAVNDGLLQLKEKRKYLDLPAYYAVRVLQPTVSGEKEREDEIALVLCSFNKEYYEQNYDPLSRELRNEIAQYNALNLKRMLDLVSPRLVGQALYEQIRWAEYCIVDWTQWRPNVFFELGVRLAASPKGALLFLDKRKKWIDERMGNWIDGKQIDQLIQLFDPVIYTPDGENLEEQVRQALIEFKEEHKIPLKKDEVYKTLMNYFDWKQERINLAPHEELLISVEDVVGTDYERIGNAQVLFAINKEYDDVFTSNVRERYIAAWLYLKNKYDKDPETDSEEKEEALIDLAAQASLFLEGSPDAYHQLIQDEIDNFLDA